VCGGAPVKIIRSYLILIILGVSSTAALGNSIPDPHIKLGPTGSQHTFNQSDCLAPSEGFSSCSFTTDAAGDPVTIDIVNDLGKSIVKDIVTIEFPSIGPLTCDADLETAPNWSGTASGNSCIFKGGFISAGFKYGLTYSLFQPSTTFFFDLEATVPEPGTIILLGTGLVALMVRRKALKRAQPV
jgi:hypothetical protein